MDVSTLSTYHVAVLQSRAQRALRLRIEHYLQKYNLTMMQWSILGFVAEAGAKGIRISDLAKAIDTSLAFITNSINTLEAKGMVRRIGYEADNRAKLVLVTDEYKDQIADIEAYLRSRMQEWFYNKISSENLATYIKVLEQIADVPA